jgi:hypothetical protein
VQFIESDHVIELVAPAASASRFGGEFWNNLPNESVPSQGIPLTKMNLFFFYRSAMTRVKSSFMGRPTANRRTLCKICSDRTFP